jgi:ribonuclease III
MPALSKYLGELGIEPKDISIYRKAFTHMSSASCPSESYERLEYLGDSVIGMVIADFLYRKFPEKEEGELSRIKASVVNSETLGRKAEELKLEKLLRVETARVRQGSRAEFSILGDIFEALCGAIFADRGYLQAKKFILTNLKNACLTAGENVGPIDYKSRLQELWQHKFKEPPDYIVVDETGPDHDKLFTIEVRYKGKLLGSGEGSSKKRAEQEAAKSAFECEIEKDRR